MGDAGIDQNHEEGRSMLCFEVYRNDEKLCTAGVDEFGVLTAIVSWVSRRPEQMALWAAEGIPETRSVETTLSVGGLRNTGSEPSEQMRWLQSSLSLGDEIRIRIVDSSEADLPVRDAS